MVRRHAAHRERCRLHPQPPKSNDALAGRQRRHRAVLDNYVTTVEATDAKTVVFTFSQAFTPGPVGHWRAVIVPEHIWKDVADPVPSPTRTRSAPARSPRSAPSRTSTGSCTRIRTTGRRASRTSRASASRPTRVTTPPTWPPSTARTTGPPTSSRTSRRPSSPRTRRTSTTGSRRTGDDVMLYVNTTKRLRRSERAQGDQHGDRPRADRQDRHVRLHPSGRRHRPERRLRPGRTPMPSPLAPRSVTLDVDEATPCSTRPAWPWTATSASCRTARSCRTTSTSSPAGPTGCQPSRSSPRTSRRSASSATVQPTTSPPGSSTSRRATSISRSAGAPAARPRTTSTAARCRRLTLEEIGDDRQRELAPLRQNPEADALLSQFAATSDEAEQKDLANQLQALFVENFPAIPLFPGPQWGEFNSTRFTDFPSEENPYAILSTYEFTERLLIDDDDQAGRHRSIAYASLDCRRASVRLEPPTLPLQTVPNGRLPGRVAGTSIGRSA